MHPHPSPPPKSFLNRLTHGCKQLVLSLAVLSGFSFPPSARAQVVTFDTEVEVYPDKLITTRRYEFQIDKRETDWLSQVTIPFQEGEEVDILEAVILDGNGKQVRALSRKEITTRHDLSEGTFFEDNRVYEFKLRWHQYPYRIRYSYRHTEKKFLYACYWFPLVYTTLPTLRATLTVTYPKDLKVRVHQRPHPDTPTPVEAVKNRLVSRWEFNQVPALPRELHSPPVRDQIPFVIIAPENFIYGVPGRLDTWSSYGNWVYRLNENLSDLPLYEQQKVQQMVKAATDPNDLMRRLYHYLQDNTRYVNVSMDVGGLKSYPASYVSTKKYGDCKALTVFMQALLSSVGVPSYFAHVHGGTSPPKVNVEVPGPQFNHMILCIPRAKDTLWLENTANYLPFNYLGTFTQNRNALLIDKEASLLVKTPRLRSSQVSCTRTYTYALDPGGTSKVVAAWRLRGEAYEHFRGLQVNGTDRDVQSALEEAIPPKDYRLVSWAFRSQNRDSSYIDIDLNLEATSIVRKLGSTTAIKTLTIPIPNFESPQARTQPVQLDYPIVETLTQIFRITELGSSRVDLPKPVNLESSVGTYRVRYDMQEQGVTVSRELVLAAGTYSLENYKDFYNFLQSIREADRNSSIILTQAP
jgi:hypothetical protein